MRCKHFERRQQARDQEIVSSSEFFRGAAAIVLPFAMQAKGWTEEGGVPIESIEQRVGLAVYAAASLMLRFYPNFDRRMRDLKKAEG